MKRALGQLALYIFVYGDVGSRLDLINAILKLAHVYLRLELLLLFTNDGFHLALCRNLSLWINYLVTIIYQLLAILIDYLLLILELLH